MTRVLFAVLLVAAFGMFAWTVRRFARLHLLGAPAGPDRPGRRAHRLGDALLLRPEEGRREDHHPRQALAPLRQRDGQQVPLLHLLGLPGHHDRLGRDADPGPVPVVLAARSCWAGRSASALYTCIDFFCGLVLVVIGVRVLPAHRPAAAPDPDEPRRRRDPGRDRAADDLVLRHALRRRRPSCDVSWWTHVVILLAFLNYLLYSKHSHIIAALPNIYFRNLGQRGVLPKLNMEADDMAATGVVQGWKDFTWKSLLDGFACTECARCTNFCPAYNTGKPLSPMQVVHDLRDDLRFQHARPRPARRAARALPARRVAGGAARRGGQAADRRPHDRGGAVGLHDLRRLPGGLPGLHRSAREDPADAPEPGAGAGEGPAGSRAHVHQPRAQRQPLGHRRGQADGLGRRA